MSLCSPLQGYSGSNGKHLLYIACLLIKAIVYIRLGLKPETKDKEGYGYSKKTTGKHAGKCASVESS